MIIYYSIMFFIFGLMFGSFYNVVGYRLPKKESLAFPSSHCTICNHKLSPFELIPVLSFLFLGGKCKSCKTKISWYYTVFELFTGLLFMLSYLVFGLTPECFVGIVLSSILIIVIISDYKYYIIPDELIVVGVLLLMIGKFLSGGFNTPTFDLILALSTLGLSLIHGFLSFIIMYLIKIIGDKAFKKESMGGGDIKLMFVIGMALSFPLSIFSIFLASFIALPISIALVRNKTDHVVPFGPFLSVGALILFFLNVNWIEILTILA
jgi:Type II secretory pathway, prepilin signal peptidase PulO and related peptidases